MTKKTFLFNATESNLHEKLLITKEIFPKNFVRTIFEKNASIKVMDDSRSISDLFLKTEEEKKKLTKKEIKLLKKKDKEKLTKKELIVLKGKKQKELPKIKEKKKKEENLYKEGRAFKLDKHVLKHKRWHDLRIELPLIPNIKNINLANNYAIKLSFFKKKFKVWSTVLIPEKGGYTVRSFGILGFLSTKQALLASIVECKKKKKNLYFSTRNRFKLKIGQRIPFLTKKPKWRFLKKKSLWRVRKHKLWIKRRKEWRKKKLIQKYKNWKNFLIKNVKNENWDKLLNLKKLNKSRKKYLKFKKISFELKKKYIHQRLINCSQKIIKQISDLKLNTKNAKVNSTIQRFYTFKITNNFSIEKQNKLQNLVKLYQKLLSKNKLMKKEEVHKNEYSLRQAKNKNKNLPKKEYQKFLKIRIDPKLDESKRKRSIKKLTNEITKLINKIMKKKLSLKKRRKASLKSPFIFYFKKIG